VIAIMDFRDEASAGCSVIVGGSITLISSNAETLAAPDFFYRFKAPPRYRQIKSHESSFIQTADVAAGFATRLMDTDGLIGVVSRFEYVTYNGARLSRSDAEERMRLGRWRYA
jgi:hypothetical protein